MRYLQCDAMRIADGTRKVAERLEIDLGAFTLLPRAAVRVPDLPFDTTALRATSHHKPALTPLPGVQKHRPILPWFQAGL